MPVLRGTRAWGGAIARIACVLLLGARLSALPALAGEAGAPETDARVAELVKQLESPDAKARLAAVKSLQKLGRRAQPAAPKLIRLALEDEVEDVRIWAGWTLRQIGCADQALPEFVKGIKHENPDRRQWAGLAILQLGPEGKAAIPDLVEALWDDPIYVRKQAAFTLAELGPALEPALDTLIAQLDDPGMRTKALNALFHIWGSSSRRAPKPPRKIMPKVIGFLDEKDDDLRVAALGAIAEFGPDAREAIPKILPFVTEKPDGLCQNAMIAIGGIGIGEPTPEARAIAPIVVGHLREGEPWTRNNARQALRGLGPAAGAVVSLTEMFISDRR